MIWLNMKLNSDSEWTSASAKHLNSIGTLERALFGEKKGIIFLSLLSAITECQQQAKGEKEKPKAGFFSWS